MNKEERRAYNKKYKEEVLCRDLKRERDKEYKRRNKEKEAKVDEKAGDELFPMVMTKLGEMERDTVYARKMRKHVF